jgi:drug/metabolite transporter (DMT)-like permease
MTGKAKGYFLGAVAAATYGMNPLFALPLYDDGMDSDSVLFFRYLFAIPLLAIMLKARGRSLAIKRCEVAPLLFIYPILVALIMAVMFHERLRAATVVCMLSALIGIALLYKNEDGSTISLVGSIIVFFSSLSYAIYLVGVNRVKAIKDEPTLKITLYVLVFGLSVFIIRLLWIGQITMPSHWYMWGNVLGLAVFPTAISFLCTTAAIQSIGSTPTAILGALEPVTAIFFGIMIFGETMSARQSVGLVLIIVAVTLVIAGGSLSVPLTRFRRLFPRLLKRK